MTPLVVSPTPDYNTFVTIAEADVLADDALSHSVWEALSPADKQRWLLLTGAMINGLKGFIAPDPTTACLQKAQVTLVLHQIDNKLQDTGPKEGQLRTRKFDVMYREHFKNVHADNKVVEDLPASIRECLKNHGALLDNSVGGVGSFGRRR